MNGKYTYNDLKGKKLGPGVVLSAKACPWLEKNFLIHNSQAYWDCFFNYYYKKFYKIYPR